MFGFLKSGLNKIGKAFSKTGAVLGKKIRPLLAGPLDEETLDRLEQILFEADLGSTLAIEFVDHVRNHGKKYDHPIEAMKAHAAAILDRPPRIEGKTPLKSPKVILMVGVNGSGKTTSCAKLGHFYKERGKKVMLAAGDTFRAAAIEQLTTWSEQLKLDCIKGTAGGDPAAVIFDALTAATARGHDVVIADTAGRLHSKTDLMHELAKIKRVTEKVVADAPHEIYLVLDATTGQNALDQAETFNRFTPLTGLILTKLDGSAKGGILLPIYHQMGIAVRYIGIGEKGDDFLPFSPQPYIDALFS
ncbi:MAG: signal recognition particle-docking protein FtsY [Chlamydiota bacterium]